MAKPILTRFIPDTMARDGTRYEVVLPLVQFSRLQGLLCDPAGVMRAVFSFSQRKDHIVISGQLSTGFTLQCQRCLNALVAVVDEPFELVFVDNEAASRQLPDACDPVVLDAKGQIHVVDLFEDELILHVPTVAKHDAHARCTSGNQQFGEIVDTQLAATETMPKARPFDILKNLDLH
jgi:uncharacterized protein